LRAPLTRHCLEEAEHAWLWTETIQELGQVPLKVTHTYQSEYGAEFGMPQDTLEILCLTQVLEKRVYDHFERHLRTPGTHPIVQRTLQKMLDDEVGHIGWVRAKLDEYADSGRRDRLESVMARLEEIDRRAYERLAVESEYSRFFGSANTSQNRTTAQS
jgi:bacterioferritin (cytochrome b1)